MPHLLQQVILKSGGPDSKGGSKNGSLGAKSSNKYLGARPLRALKVISRILKSILIWRF